LQTGHIRPRFKGIFELTPPRLRPLLRCTIARMR
jgi:hypothetical protein